MCRRMSGSKGRGGTPAPELGDGILHAVFGDVMHTGGDQCIGSGAVNALRHADQRHVSRFSPRAADTRPRSPRGHARHLPARSLQRTSFLSLHREQDRESPLRFVMRAGIAMGEEPFALRKGADLRARNGVRREPCAHELSAIRFPQIESRAACIGGEEAIRLDTPP